MLRVARYALRVAGSALRVGAEDWNRTIAPAFFVYKDMSNCQDLVVWKQGIDLSRQIFRLVKAMPRDIRYAVGNQLMRSALSVPSNLAEGSGRYSRKEMIRFTRYSLGSLYELESHLLALDDCLPKDEVASLLAETEVLAKRLSGLIRSLKPPRSSAQTEHPTDS